MDKEYIEREAALKAMSQAIQDRTWSMDDADVIEQMETNVEELPAADVAPVIHGEWIPNEKMIRSPYARNWHCCVCGNSPIETLDYCGRCGARMDGGNSNG